jgi:hypothetical protein
MGVSDNVLIVLSDQNNKGNFGKGIKHHLEEWNQP